MGTEKGTKRIKLKRDFTSLAKALKEARENIGLKQEEVAESIGRTKETISRYENAVYPPSKNSLKSLAKLYSIPYEKLEAIAQGETTENNGSIKVTPKPTLQAVIHALQELGSNLEDDDLEVLLAYVLIKSARRGEKKT